VINALNKNYSHITGSDEVWFNSGDQCHYKGSSRQLDQNGNTVPSLGVIDGTSVLIETIPQGSGSHSVAADRNRNRIYIPQVAPISVGSGGDTTGVSAGICGSTNGCVAVYVHPASPVSAVSRLTAGANAANWSARGNVAEGMKMPRLPADTGCALAETRRAR
jgi:hypothetical protein